MLEGFLRCQACLLLSIFTAPDQELILCSVQIAGRTLGASLELPHAIAVRHQGPPDLQAISSNGSEPHEYCLQPFRHHHSVIEFNVIAGPGTEGFWQAVSTREHGLHRLATHTQGLLPSSRGSISQARRQGADRAIAIEHRGRGRTEKPTPPFLCIKYHARPSLRQGLDVDVELERPRLLQPEQELHIN